MFSIKKIIVSVVLVFFTLILIAIIFGSSSYTSQTVNNKEIMTLTTMEASIIETTYKIKTTLTPTTTEQLKSVIQTGNNSDCEALGCPSGTMFVGSKTSKKYHDCDCTWVKKISQQNLVCFKSIEEAQNSGYVPCKVCKPQ